MYRANEEAKKRGVREKRIYLSRRNSGHCLGTGCGKKRDDKLQDMG